MPEEKVIVLVRSFSNLEKYPFPHNFPTSFGFLVSLSVLFVCGHCFVCVCVCLNPLNPSLYVKRIVLHFSTWRRTQNHFVNINKLLDYPQLTSLRSSSLARINFSLTVQMDTRKASRCIVANQKETQQGN